MDAPLLWQGRFPDQTPGRFNQDKKQHPTSQVGGWRGDNNPTLVWKGLLGLRATANSAQGRAEPRGSHQAELCPDPKGDAKVDADILKSERKEVKKGAGRDTVSLMDGPARVAEDTSSTGNLSTFYKDHNSAEFVEPEGARGAQTRPLSRQHQRA